MALDLDDKILGEKVNNYISSSEDEDEGDVGAEHPEYSYGEAEYSYGEADCSQSQPSIEPVVEPPVIDRSRTSATGPKGVLEDYKRFKEMEAQKREQQREELRALTHRIAMTCRPSGEVSVLSNNEDLEFDQEFDAIFEEYKLQRMNEMETLLQSVPSFGDVINLNADSFVTSIDNEHYLVTIIILVHDPVNSKLCDAMFACLRILAKEYQKVKFCAIAAQEAGLSDKFRYEATPAFLVYKNKQQIGTFVQLVQELGDEIFAVDVEKFLIEHALLPTIESRLLIEDPRVNELD